MKEFINLKQLAKNISVSEATIRRWIKAKNLPCYRFGKAYKFKQEEISKWITDRKETAQ